MLKGLREDCPAARSLEDLEHSIGLAGYMRHNIPCFAMKIKPLEQQKTNLHRLNAPTKPKGKTVVQLAFLLTVSDSRCRHHLPSGPLWHSR